MNFETLENDLGQEKFASRCSRAVVADDDRRSTDVQDCVEIKILRRVRAESSPTCTPSMRRLLDGVAMPFLTDSQAASSRPLKICHTGARRGVRRWRDGEDQPRSLGALVER